MIIPFEKLSLQNIKKYQELGLKITGLIRIIPVGMFCLDCTQLNEDLAKRCQSLANKLINFIVDQNREINKKFVNSLFFL